MHLLLYERLAIVYTHGVPRPAYDCQLARIRLPITQAGRGNR